MNKLINIKSYRNWCDNAYIRGKSLPEGKVIFCNTEDVKYLFDTIQHYPERKIVLVSADSDFGIHYQKEAPVNGDLIKCAQTIDYENATNYPEYVKIGLATADYAQCNINDKYSVKIDRYTINTFDKIPPNIIKWFCANANIEEPQVEYIPYGANVDTEANGIFEYYKRVDQKTKIVYANFRNNSLERQYLGNNLLAQIEKNRLNKIASLEEEIEPDWVTFVGENIPVQEYYEQMGEHKYCLCPRSNGIDSYRFIESLAVGTIPIVFNSRHSNTAAKHGFPIIRMDNMININYHFVKLLNNIENKIWQTYDNQILTENYWQKKILQSISLL